MKLTARDRKELLRLEKRMPHKGVAIRIRTTSSLITQRTTKTKMLKHTLKNRVVVLSSNSYHLTHQT